jgi:uncharacterized protein (DUF433 family)
MTLSRKDVVVKDPEILGGVPVFRGACVPVQTLFDYLEGGETLEEFLAGFPTVTREIAIGALEAARELLSARAQMRVLIDDCIDERLRNSLPTHECHTARFAGFAGLKNGELLNAAESGQYDVLVTVDQGLEYEQNLTGRRLAITVLRAKSNRLKDLLSYVPACLAYLFSIRPGEIVKIPG